MGRPRKDQDTASAKERIEIAFWQLLEEEPSKPITVRALTQRAGVNHNTFYYHYSCIEDLSISLVTEYFSPDTRELFRAVVTKGTVNFDDIACRKKAAEAFSKLKLILGSNNTKLVKLGERHIASIFLETLDIAPEQLKARDREKMAFIFGGITALISHDEIKTFDDYYAVLQDGIVDLIIETWRTIVSKQ